MFTFTDALILASKAHNGMKDKGYVEFIKHPLHLAHNLKIKGYSNEHQITALLHDVIEDTEWTIEQLKELHVPESVLDALELLTHVVDEEWIEKFVIENTHMTSGISKYEVRCYAKEREYLNYIEKLKHNDIARAVKIEDLDHNSDISRLPKLDDYAVKRLVKYEKARRILSPKGC